MDFDFCRFVAASTISQEDMREHYFADQNPPSSGWPKSPHLYIDTLEPLPKTFSKMDSDEFLAAALTRVSDLIDDEKKTVDVQDCLQQRFSDPGAERIVSEYSPTCLRSRLGGRMSLARPIAGPRHLTRRRVGRGI